MSSDSKSEKLLNAFKTNCGKWVCSTHNSESGQPAAIFREIKKQGYVFEEVTPFNKSSLFVINKVGIDQGSFGLLV